MPFDGSLYFCQRRKGASLQPLHVIVRPSQDVDPRFPPVLQDQTPRYDDPSKRGSG